MIFENIIITYAIYIRIIFLCYAIRYIIYILFGLYMSIIYESIQAKSI